MYVDLQLYVYKIFHIHIHVHSSQVKYLNVCRWINVVCTDGNEILQSKVYCHASGKFFLTGKSVQLILLEIQGLLLSKYVHKGYCGIKCSCSTKCVRSIFSFSLKHVICFLSYFIWFCTLQIVCNITLVSW